MLAASLRLVELGDIAVIISGVRINRIKFVHAFVVFDWGFFVAVAVFVKHFSLSS